MRFSLRIPEVASTTLSNTLSYLHQGQAGLGEIAHTASPPQATHLILLSLYGSGEKDQDGVKLWTSPFTQYNFVHVHSLTKPLYRSIRASRQRVSVGKMTTWLSSSGMAMFQAL